MFQESTIRLGGIPQIITFVLSRLPSSIGLRYLIQLFAFEVLRRRLPSLLFLLSSSLFGISNHSQQKKQSSKRQQQQPQVKDQIHDGDFNSESDDHEESKTAEGTDNQVDGKNKQSKAREKGTRPSHEQRHIPQSESTRRILERTKAVLFQENWHEVANEIREEVVHLFNLEKQLLDVNRNLNLGKKSQQWDAIKKETFCFLPFAIVTNTLLLTTRFLQELLKAKHADTLATAYPALHDPTEIAHSILHEFFEQLTLVGMKNVKSFFKHKLTRNLADLVITNSFDVEEILTSLDEYILLELLRSNPLVKKPSDHRKKRSSISMFRNSSSKRSNSNNNLKSASNQPQSQPQQQQQQQQQHQLQQQQQQQQLQQQQHFLKQVNSYFTHDAHINANSYQQTKHDLEVENTAVLAHSQPILAPTALLDIMQIFIGDIENHKILTDTDFIEKHIEIADCRCREQRYQPSLSCIPEADDDDGGYESDQSDSHERYHLYSYNPSKAASKQQSTSIQGKHRKASYDKSSSSHQQSQAHSKHVGRKFSGDFYEKHVFQEDIDDFFDAPSSAQSYQQSAMASSTKRKLHSTNLSNQLNPVNGNNNINVNAQPFIRKKSEKTKTSMLLQGGGWDEDEKSTTRPSNNQENAVKSTAKSNSNTTNNDDYDRDTREFASLRATIRAQTCIDGEEEDYSPKNRTNPQNREADHLKKRNGSRLQGRNAGTSSNNQDPSDQLASSSTTSVSSQEDSIEIAENRTRLAHFLWSVCLEALETMESANFQTYLYYAVLFQYKKFKNRFRAGAADATSTNSHHHHHPAAPTSGAGISNNSNGNTSSSSNSNSNNSNSYRSGKHMKLINIVVMINRIIEDHFLSEDAPSRCEAVYTKAKADAERIIGGGCGVSSDKKSSTMMTNGKPFAGTHAQSSVNMSASQKMHAVNIARIFEEMDQSRIIRESFDELSAFFINY